MGRDRTFEKKNEVWREGSSFKNSRSQNVLSCRTRIITKKILVYWYIGMASMAKNKVYHTCRHGAGCSFFYTRDSKPKVYILP